MGILSILIISIYCILILYFTIGFNKISDFKLNNHIPKNKFSIIVPFRNEVENLPALLKSFSQIDYPENLFEIILVNDDSTDDYLSVLNHFKMEFPKLCVKLFQNKIKSLSPKKDAVELAISQAEFDWIITTDADCIVPNNWLIAFDSFLQENSCTVIVAPVAYSFNKSFLNHFQNLDFLSLQGSTIGSFGVNKPFMCNGANLCYNKQTFLDVNGFEGNNNIASGDDVFLMQKFLIKDGNSVKYLKSDHAIVQTKTQPTWNLLIQQRIRWAAKAGSYNNSFGKIVGLVVFITNIYLFMLLFLAFFNKISWQHISLFYLMKLNIDFLLLYKTADFFKQQDSLKSYLYSSFIYPFFNVYVAILSFFKGYEWKGRQFKK